jgi:hypothetical protein
MDVRPAFIDPTRTFTSRMVATRPHLIYHAPAADDSAATASPSLPVQGP